MSDRTRSLARASVSAAAGTAALYLGSVIPGVRLSVLFIATLGVVFVRLSCSGAWAWGCYAVTAALALLLLPDKTLALLYALFPGYYPIAKLRLERLGSPWGRWGAKLACFHAALAVVWLLARWLTPLSELLSAAALWMLWAGALAVFLVYDFVLGQLILYYLRKFAGRIR